MVLIQQPSEVRVRAADLSSYPTRRALDWGAGGPPPLPAGAISVHVTLLVPPASADGPAMAAALAALAAAGGPSSFGDPGAWQREVRADRPQPSREE